LRRTGVTTRENACHAAHRRLSGRRFPNPASLLWVVSMRSTIGAVVTRRGGDCHSKLELMEARRRTACCQRWRRSARSASKHPRAPSDHQPPPFTSQQRTDSRRFPYQAKGAHAREPAPFASSRSSAILAGTPPPHAVRGARPIASNYAVRLRHFAPGGPTDPTRAIFLSSRAAPRRSRRATPYHELVHDAVLVRGDRRPAQNSCRSVRQPLTKRSPVTPM